MNERIKELAEQATEKFTTYFDGRGNVSETYFDKEKFAELIVGECLGVVEMRRNLGNTEICRQECKALAAEIKAHFGVEL